MKEFELIKKFFVELTNRNEAAQNLVDDVAKISLKNDEELVVSKDLLLEDYHFLRSDGAFKIASKLLRANLSDLAASGAKPLYYMLGFSKNAATDEKFMRQFSRGLKSVQDAFDLCLIGGDTVASEKLFFSVTIFGAVKKGKNMARSQAVENDLIFVSGNIGDAFLGLAMLQKIDLNLDAKNLSKTEKKYILDRHFFPTPQIELAKKLSEKKLSKCAIDVSDGLFSDLRHICQASKLDAEIYLNELPISDAAKKILIKNPQINSLDLFSGGDDYELIFSANTKNKKKILELAKNLKIKISCIGNFKKAVKQKFAITLRDAKNQKIKIKKFGYEH